MCPVIISAVVVGVWERVCGVRDSGSPLSGEGQGMNRTPSFVHLSVPSLADQLLSLLICAAYSSSLCPIFCNPPRLSYPDGVISRKGHPLSTVSLVHSHFDPVDPILLNGSNICDARKLHHLTFVLELRSTQWTQWTKGGKCMGEAEKQIAGQKNHPQEDIPGTYRTKIDEP